MPWYSNPDNLKAAVVLLSLLICVMAVSFYVLFLQNNFLLKENMELVEAQEQLELQVAVLTYEVSRDKSRLPEPLKRVE